MDPVLRAIKDDWESIQAAKDRLSRNLAKGTRSGVSMRWMALVTGVPRTTARRLLARAPDDTFTP